MSSKSAMGCELCLCIECPNHEEAFCLESIKSNVRKPYQNDDCKGKLLKVLLVLLLRKCHHSRDQES